jgi:hypothetical protein
MNDRDTTYAHTASVTGVESERADPALEHQDTASGDATDRNEIELRRGRPGRHGPTTHDDTRIDRKGE